MIDPKYRGTHGEDMRPSNRFVLLLDRNEDLDHHSRMPSAAGNENKSHFLRFQL